MTESYQHWTKAKIQAELRSRSLDDHGTTRTLRERLRADDSESLESEAEGGGNGSQRAGEPEPSGAGDRGRDHGSQRAREPGGNGSGAGGGRAGEPGGNGSGAGGGRAREPGANGSGAAGGGDDGAATHRGTSSGAAPRAGKDGRRPAALPTDVRRRALSEIRAITGRQVERIVAVRREGAGWRLAADLIDYARVPRSGEWLATYEATVDAEGRVTSCDRKGGYTRGRSDRRAPRG